jgi:hypothetical protein
LGSDPTKKLGVQQPPLPSPPNEKRGAEEYATTSMSIVMATNQMPALLAIAAAFFTIALLRFRKTVVQTA